MNISLYIEEDKLDLFKDETIEITSSVQDVNDITKNTMDFSKNFNVPTSDNNNKIFKHWYRADIDNGFDARTKVSGRIEINGVVFKYGKFSLLGAKITKGKISSYSIVFYGNGINLVDLLGNDELSELDLSAFDHAYSDLNVYKGLLNYNYNTGNYPNEKLFNNDIIYPLIAKKRYYFNSNGTNDGAQEINNNHNIANVGWANGIDWTDLRASLRMIRIVEAIETKYGFTFSRDFFGSVNFYDLYLWLDNSSDKLVTTKNKLIYNEVGYFLGNATALDFYLNANGNLFIARVPDRYFNYTGMYATVRTNAPDNNIPYTLIVLANGVEVGRYEKTGANDVFDTPFFLVSLGTEYTFFIESNQAISSQFVSVNLRGNPRSNIWSVIAGGIRNLSTQNFLTYFKTKNQLPKLKVIDFLKGLFSMFKLVFVQEKDTDPIYVNTLNNYYSEAVLYDITEYVSTNSADVERGKLLNEISYKFEDPQTILAKQFKANEGIAFGDAEIKLTEDGTPNSPKLDGEKEEIKVPFEQVIYERLNNSNDNLPIEVQYGAVIDDKYDAVNLKPLIHYYSHNELDRFVKLKKANGTFITWQGKMNMPTVMRGGFTGEAGLSLTFDREQNSYTGGFNDNSLYNVFHSDYITSIFNFKRRNFKFEAKLPLRIILNLKQKDVLKINDNYYRINTWTYNLLTGKCKLDLINSFDNTIAGFNASRTIITTDGTAKIESIYVTNFTNMIFDYTADWINSATYLGNNVYFGIDANDTGLFRTETVTLINTDTLAEIEITINQNANPITFGNEIINWGSNVITFES